MDQDAYRQTYLELNDRVCVFEKSILSGLCRCSRSEKFNLAEREGIHCHSDESQQRCERFIETLRTQARFTLRTASEHDPLPHNKAMRLQVGGMRGLQMTLTEEEVVPMMVNDVDGLLGEAEQRYGMVQNIPFDVLIQQIAAYKGRQRKKR